MRVCTCHMHHIHRLTRDSLESQSVHGPNRFRHLSCFRNFVCNFIRHRECVLSPCAAYQFRRRYGCTRRLECTEHGERVRYAACKVIRLYRNWTHIHIPLIVFRYLNAVSAFDDGQYKPAGDTQSYGNLKNSIPGEPDVDYPIYAMPPDTSFRCRGRANGEIFFFRLSTSHIDNDLNALLWSYARATLFEWKQKHCSALWRT